MTQRIFNQRPGKMGRNGQIWYAVAVAGLTQAAVAEQFGLSEQRISIICKQVEKTIPPEEKDTTRKYRKEFLNELRAECLEMALMDPVPAVAPNGKVIPGIMDYSQKLAAIDRLLKIDERYAKLTGTDNAVEHSVTVTAEAQQATKDQADKIGAQFANLIPESAEVSAHAARG